MAGNPRSNGELDGGLRLHRSPENETGYLGVFRKKQRFRAKDWDPKAKKMVKIGGSYATVVEAAVAFARHRQATGRLGPGEETVAAQAVEDEVQMKGETESEDEVQVELEEELEEAKEARVVVKVEAAVEDEAADESEDKVQVDVEGEE